MTNQLHYGDNLEVLRKYIKDESVDLCYIDPPFNSQRNYNQIYTNRGKEDQTQVQAFIDTWTWDNHADLGLAEILTNYDGKFTRQCISLINGLTDVLGKGSLLAYLVSMTLRITEIHRVLKPTGSFYFHCDSSASHYLKLILDAVFCSQGGDFKNEIIWQRSLGHNLAKQRFDVITDTILFYIKSNKFTFNPQYEKLDFKQLEKKFPYWEKETGRRFNHQKLEKSSNAYSIGQTRIIQGKEVTSKVGWLWSQETFDQRLAENPYLIYWTETGRPRYKLYLDEYQGKLMSNLWTETLAISSNSQERLGYPTQKPEALLERIIKASSNENDVILDAYCGCGTTVAVAQKLNRNWIAIDITYQSISLVLKRLEDSFDKEVLTNINFQGIPKDLESAIALANKQDDRTRKEFEKWAVLTYSNNRAVINTNKGKDEGIDGFAYFRGDRGKQEKIIFQVKSGKVKSGDIRDLIGTMILENASIAIFITLQNPTKEMISMAKKAGFYQNKYFSQNYDKIQIVTVKDIIENQQRLNVKLGLEVLKSAEKIKEAKEAKADQIELNL